MASGEIQHIPTVLSGSSDVAVTQGVVSYETITFDKPFSSIPSVICNPQASNGTNYAVTARNITSSSFQACAICTSATGHITYNWIAVG